MKKVINNTLKPIFIAASIIFGISTASAGPNEGRGGHQLFILPFKAPDLGVAHLSAVVTADGKFVRGSGVKNVVPAGSFGDYIVTFRRNVTNCTYVASLGNTGSIGVPQTGVISATGANIDPNGVYLDVNDIDGFSAERPFHLNVFCHK